MMDMAFGSVWFYQFPLRTMLQALIVSALFMVVAFIGKKSRTIFAKPGDKEMVGDNGRRLDHAFVSQNQSIIILYGSQTGTAEDYARRLARNLYEDYSTSARVANIEDFDASSLSMIGMTSLATRRRMLVCFVLATYGEGKPTDSTVSFYEDLAAMGVEDGECELPLQNLYYVAFGLGKKSYERFNFMIRSFDEHLQRLGATRSGARSEGDDGFGTLDEDFLVWKDNTLPEVADHIGMKKSHRNFESPYEIIEKPDMAIHYSQASPGERNAAQLDNNDFRMGFFDNKHSYMAPIVHSRQLFASNCGNECLHIEFDISGTNLTYETGDHLGVWPINPEEEVQRLLAVLGLSKKADTFIEILGKNGQMFPSPKTYFEILQHKLDICGKVSREICSTLIEMAPNAEVRGKIARLAKDKEYFQSNVTSRCLNLGQLLEVVGNGTPWASVPFAFLLSCLAPLQPRYYSISSSNRAFPTTIHITVAVKDEFLGGTNPRRFLGLTTNYLRTLTMKKDINGEVFSNQSVLPSSQAKNLSMRAAVHVRHSPFRLPPSPQTPIIMIGPGTGVAPFRAFIQERLLAKHQTPRLGTSVLFTGCRKSTEDYLYAQEWEELKKSLGDDFQIYIAFSRETVEKVYVQHRMMEVKEQIFDLIKNRNAWVYICDDAAHMAKDVHRALVNIIAGGKNITLKDAVKDVTSLKDQGLMHEDIW